MENVPIGGKLRQLSDYGAAEQGSRRMIARGVRLPNAPAETAYKLRLATGAALPFQR